jgi:hypothetical protein
MDANTEFWMSRRVLVCNCTDRLASLLAEQFVNASAEVSGLISSKPSDESYFLKAKLYETIKPIRTGQYDAPAIARALAVSEIEAIILPNCRDTKATHAMLAAARVALPHAAILVTVSSPASRAVAMVNRFRDEKLNPIGLAIVSDSQIINDEKMVLNWMMELTERTIRREANMLTGRTELPSRLRIAA